MCRVGADQRRALRQHSACCSSSPSSCQRRHPSDREHSQQGVPATSQIPCWKMRLMLKLHLVPTKVLSCSFIFLRTVPPPSFLPPVHRINESQLFLGFTIRCSVFGQRSIACKTLCRSKLCVWSIIIFLYKCFQLLGFFVRLYASGQFNKKKESLLSLQTHRFTAHFFWISKFERWANYHFWKMSLNTTKLFSFTCLSGNISTNSKFRGTVYSSNWFLCRGSKPRRHFSPSFLPPYYSGGFMCSFSLLMHCPHWLEAIGFRLESFSVPSASRKKGVI